MLNSNLFGTNKDGTAVYFECEDSDQCKNYITYSSMFQNADQTVDSKTTFTLQKGSVFLNYFNFTNNKCKSSGLFKILGSHSVYYGYTLFIQNTIDEFPSIIENSANFREFILSNNECSYHGRDKYMFSTQNSDASFAECYLQDYYHYNAFYIDGSITVAATYYCVGLVARGNQYWDNECRGYCLATPPGFDIPVTNYCSTNENSNQIRRADKTYDDRSGKRHVGVVALLGYSSIN
ncbi:hypothetical protein TVAG_070030 [Trichomonas vaginalis G3]|uniref:Uncharacterized protein n=1 Tax=Trichomonas vaginalis (strain ATCC PRA-98 / G3) TaxID=412133 RepID=A2ESP4_TRIV3|nr:hypothetical protein TVAGG3_0220860 [Trichomonas vaginalis G3]EAY04353.1 hypothetical protein TVAG_070030 [Trichomonas vaginalis G3]KAI5551926.1 hypothetical protein TVAGG3_0220860 [Trichomonas vaginalis G3]|eukprot:XP_001316576.1 hypothetical protein [Trichomonas vaginalis G3]